MSKRTTPRTSNPVQKATQLSAHGKDKEALEVIQAHLQRYPRDREALNLAGTLAARLANWELAESYFSATLTHYPSDTYALYNLSKVFKLSNRVGEAINVLTRLLQIEPANTQALNEFGVLLMGQGHLDPALKAFETAIELDPSFEQAYRNMYTTLYTGAHFEEAARIAKKAISALPRDQCFNARAALILCLWKSRALDEGKQVAEELVYDLDHSSNPLHRETLPQALNNYGVLLMEMDEPDAAETKFQRAITLAPDMLDLYINLARLEGFRENFQEAISWFGKALALDPENTNLHTHLAIFFRDAGRPDLALPHNLSCLARNPADEEARHSLGLTQRALGLLQDSYQNLESRWSNREGGVKSELPIPEWTGTSTTARSLLVYREQGIGDEIIFASCLPDILDRFERILCVCHSKLLPLFSRSFPEIEFRSADEALTQADIDTLDRQIAIGSLPAIVRPSIGSFPDTPQFLIPDPERVEIFRQRLLPLRKTLTIGIGWRSGLLALHRKTIYPYLEYWQPIFAIPGITWVNLQYGDVAEELKTAEARFGVSIVNFDDVDHFNNLDASAALMKTCDLVIGPDTSTSVLAAALGVPTICIKQHGDSFQLGTPNFPWLPSLMPISRHFGDPWTVPIEQTATIVRSLQGEHSASL